jgi:thiol-disulfide isomerase/thioredoxin
MLDAKAMLGSAGSQVQLLGIDANPKATAVQDVLSYSELHGLQHQWRFLTGSLPQLKQTWKRYSIGVSITQRQIDHSPAVFIIDRQGRRSKLYVTQQSYAAVGQFAQLLAHQASALLPSQPQVHSDISYRHIAGVSPATAITVPKAGGGSVQLGPGQPRLLLFFATWNRQTTGLAGQLQALNAYQSAASAQRLPRLTAVDEASVEPSPTALPAFMAELPKPLEYPVAVDRSGRLADGYEVQGQPWLVLTSPTGRILWYWQVSTSGWPSPSGLIRQVRNALARAPRTAPNQQALAGSPAPLAALHSQAGQLLGGQNSLAARIRALHGYPIVLNAWASWCTPCKSEFGLLASASARYGRKVAFLGADTDDSSGDAQAFLGQHPVSYPSYQDTTAGLHSVIPQGVLGLPTTVFIDRTGKVSYVHTGQYDSQGTLDGEIAAYALGH